MQYIRSRFCNQIHAVGPPGRHEAVPLMPVIFCTDSGVHCIDPSAGPVPSIITAFYLEVMSLYVFTLTFCWGATLSKSRFIFGCTRWPQNIVKINGSLLVNLWMFIFYLSLVKYMLYKTLNRNSLAYLKKNMCHNILGSRNEILAPVNSKGILLLISMGPGYHPSSFIYYFAKWCVCGFFFYFFIFFKNSNIYRKRRTLSWLVKKRVKTTHSEKPHTSF